MIGSKDIEKVVTLLRQTPNPDPPGKYKAIRYQRLWMKSKVSYSLHDKCKPVTERSTYQKPASIPINYGHAMGHFPVIGSKMTMNIDGMMVPMPIIGYGAPLTFRRMFTQPAVLWPHLRAENRIKELVKSTVKDKDGNDILRYPAMVAVLTAQMERQKVEFDRFKTSIKASIKKEESTPDAKLETT